MTKLDTTDPFGNWHREKTISRIAECRPPRHHKWLRDHPPTHCLVKGQVAVVTQYKGDHLWEVTINQQPLTDAV